MSDLTVMNQNLPTEFEQTVQDQTESKDEDQFLTFVLQDEVYGLDILKVQEIRGWTKVTQMPNSPDFIRGVMNLRGAIVPILDLRRRFNMDETEFTMQTVVVVVNVQQRTIGMIVDQVSDVVDIDEKSIRQAPDFGTSIDSSFIKGLVPVNEKMIILLNVDEMLESCELLELDRVSSNADAMEV